MKMYIKPITKQQLNEYLSIPDLTNDPKSHAIKLVYEKIADRVRSIHPSSTIEIHRKDPIVSIKDNYDNLNIAKDNISRSSTYTHYVDNTHILRTHTTAQIPGILRELAKRTDWDDVVILLPGLAYRRDVTDKKHVGQVHMLEMWRVCKNNNITKSDLLKTVRAIAEAAAPGWKLRIVDSPHPYTEQGIEVNAINDDNDIEILECGLINKHILSNAGLDPSMYSGWALGMGLDRLVMTLKQIPDIRYLRSKNPAIAKQMQNLNKYIEVSDQPAIKRDMSYSVPTSYVEEDINEEIRQALGANEPLLESVEILSTTNYVCLPVVAVEKLGIKPNQKNILVRVTLRSLEASITNDQANKIYSQIYPKINHGTAGYYQ